MKKTSKALWCTMLTAMVLCVCIMPCFADGVYPTENNTLTGIQTLQPVGDGWTYENCEAVAEIVEKAYRLNYFSSGVPVAVTYDYNSIQVLVVPYVYYAYYYAPDRTNYEGYKIPTVGTSRNYITGVVEGTSTTRIKAKNNVTGEYYPMMLYRLNEDNTFFPSNATTIFTRYDPEMPSFNEYSLALDLIDSFQKETTNIIAIRYGENDWRTPYAQGYSEVNYTINNLNEWYENQLTSTIINETVEYQLDVPAIITAIPNGAKQIINNAFGFEIFGINIAGLMSVLLIVTIVAFVIKWLMSR